MAEDLKKLSPETTSDLCHDSADALKKAGAVLPAPAGPIVAAVGAGVELVCDIYDVTHGLETKDEDEKPSSSENAKENP